MLLCSLIKILYSSMPSQLISKILCYCALALGLNGCATYYGAAAITSTPVGAQVINLEDNSVVGITPTVVSLKDGSDRRQHIILRFKKDGYYDKTDSFWLTMRHRTLEEANQSLQSLTVELQKKGE